MRKTKCKECKGVGYPMFNQCKDFQGAGEINVFTIQEEIEQEEKMKEDSLQKLKKMYGVEPVPNIEELKPIIQEPEFKWGEYVESDFRPGRNAIYVAKYPAPNGGHIVVFEDTPEDDEFYCVVGNVRKLQKTIITLSQIAEAFKCKPEQIVIPELNQSKI